MGGLGRLQACCSGAGMLRGYVGAFGDDRDDEPFQDPCWCQSPIGGGNIGLTAMTYLKHPMGYDSDKDWAVIAQDGGTDGLTIGEVKYGDFRDCQLTTFAGDAIGVAIHTLFDDSTGLDIKALSLPGGGVTEVRCLWSAISKADDEWRVYGLTSWNDSGTYHMKVWSVNYDGDDYTVHSSDTVAGSLPTMTVTDGEVIVTDYNADPAGLLLKGQRLNHSFGTGLYIESTPSDYVYFGAKADGTNYYYASPFSGWSHKFKGIITLWEFLYTPTILGYPTLPDSLDRYYATLSTEPLSTGNIVGQDGTTVHRFHALGAGGADIVHGFGVPNIGGSSPLSWLVPVEWCSMPAAIEIEQADDVPPEVPVPTCDNFTDCTGFTQLYFSIDEITPPAPVAGEEWFLEVLEGTYELPNTPALDPGIVNCVSTTKETFYLPLCDYSGETVEDLYAARGSYLFRVDTDPGVSKIEYYGAAIAVTVSCVNGLVSKTVFNLYTQRFYFNWNGSGWDLNTSFHSLECDGSSSVIDSRGAPMSSDCKTTSAMITKFNYSIFGEDFTFFSVGDII